MKRPSQPWAWLTLSVAVALLMNHHAPLAQASAPSCFSRRRRSLVMFGTMDGWIQRQQHGVLLASATTHDYKLPPMEDEDEEYHAPEDDQPRRIVESPPQAAAPPEVSTTDNAPQKNQRVKMWPPWPFNLLSRGRGSPTVRQGPVASMGGFVWGFFGQRARVGFKELQDIGSRLWFHLPPMTPPLLLLTLLPRQESQIITSEGAETVVTKTVIPLISNPLARTLVLTGFSLAIMSWAHAELNRFRRLTPLPLNDAYREIHYAVLPHALPEEVPEPFIVEDEEEYEQTDEQEEKPAPSPTKSSSISQKLSASVPPRLQKHFKQFGSTVEARSNKKKSPPAWRKNMKRMREARRSEAQKVRRMAIYDELVALQAIKRKAAANQPVKKSSRKGKAEEEPLGYALVTGASRGIGRAIAVELARWEIPLILVARDLPRLTSLAYDLEACYGIKCCVLQADLSQPHAAEQIHRATQEAGLVVDILVNNAGISSTGLAVDMPLQEVDRMIQVNGVAVTHLAHLYGKDMKERRRGRILMVSSVVGATTAGPTVAMYAATKAFEKTLGLSLAKEMEPYGVGVTCLMPGAVKDTDFRSAMRGSSAHEALCWKLPGYPKKPETVAKMGIHALLTGNVEVTPGWQNRAFLKVLQPAMPQRLHNILVEIAWNPLMVPTFLKLWKSPENRQNERQQKLKYRNKHHPVDEVEGETSPRKPSAQEWRPRSNQKLPPPLLLKVPGEESTSLPVDEPEPEEVQPLLVGQDPIVETVDPLALETKPVDKDTAFGTVAGAEQEEPNDPAGDQYEELRKLSPDLYSNPTEESTKSSSDAESQDNNSAEIASDSQQRQQQPQQHQPERQMLQLQEQLLKLQQQVQKQEREQFLKQMENERRQRELEYERRDMERERERQEQEARELAKERDWRKRPAKRAAEQRPQREEVPSSPKVVKPKPKRQQRQDEGSKQDLMSESLDHPLFSQ